MEDRTAYGAVVVTTRGPELLTASGTSPLVARLLRQAVAEQASATGTPARTVAPPGSGSFPVW